MLKGKRISETPDSNWSHLAHPRDVGELSHLLLDRVWHDHDDFLGFEEVVGEEWWAGGEGTISFCWGTGGAHYSEVWSQPSILIFHSKMEPTSGNAHGYYSSDNEDNMNFGKN